VIVYKNISVKNKAHKNEVPAARQFYSVFDKTGLVVLSLIGLCLPLFFFYLGGWGWFDPDEGRYAEIPREMLARGDWITPHLNYVAYFEKPPLLYWLTALFFRVFGLHEWAGRLVPALAATAGVLLTYMLGRRMFNARAGFLGAVVLATSTLYAFLAHELLIDMLFSVLLFAALALWWVGHSEENAKRQSTYFLGFWSTLALAMMAKGPVAVLLAVVVIGAYLLLCRPPRALREMQWLPGILLFALIAAPWYVLVAQRNPAFNNFFWYGQHIARFLGKGENREHVQSFAFFFKFLPLLFFPWTFFVPAAFFFGWKKLWPARTPHQRAVIFLLATSLLILLFFSGSTSKLIPYILPIFPPMAILMGVYFDRLIGRAASAPSKIFLGGGWLLTALLAALAVVMFYIASKNLLRAEGVGHGWAIFEGALFLLWALALVVAMRKRNPALVAAVTAGGFALFFAGTMPLISVAAPNRQVLPLLQYIQPGLNAGGEIILDGDLTQSVMFYTRRRVRVTGDGDEIRFGASLLLDAERRKWFLHDGDDAALRRAMQSPQPVYGVIKSHARAQEYLQDMPPGTQEIIWNRRRSIIGNRAAARLTPPRGNLLEQAP
jgi:4-amino-4-deoxy-L-arabinose transferase-like glycosyltransferase